MPELPEVEHYRQTLLPLVCCRHKGRQSNNNNKQQHVQLEFGPPPLPTKRFPSEETIRLINNGNYVISDVLRKGKVLCLVLEKNRNNSRSIKAQHDDDHDVTTNQTNNHDNDSITGNETILLLTMHMGMTGRISSPKHIPKLESLSDECSYPPPHTHLIIKSDTEEACFSDPRRFGSVFVHGYNDNNGNKPIDEECIPSFQDLAPDALLTATGQKASTNNHDGIVAKLSNQRKGIKAILLDQREVISGVGNWVADEVLYRSSIHPDQSFLTVSEAISLVDEMQFVLSTAVQCLNDGQEFPDSWLFHHRWRGAGSNSDKKFKDFNGKPITFVKSGGRSSGRTYVSSSIYSYLIFVICSLNLHSSLFHSYSSLNTEKDCKTYDLC